MKALILAGGYATRLAPVSLRTPKVMLPVAGKPAIQHIVEKLVRAGITDIVVSTSSSQRSIATGLGDGRRLGARISYSFEETRRDAEKPGAVGALVQLAEKLGIDDDCLVVNGDNYFVGLDFKKVVALKKRKKAALVNAVHQLADKSFVQLFGVAVLGAGGRIVKFQEKPRVEEAISTLASTGVYLFDRKFLKEIPHFVEKSRREGVKADRPGDLLKHFVDKRPLYGFPFQGFWSDLNTCESYLELNKFAMGAEPPRQKRGSGIEIDRSAIVREPVIIGDGCRVGRDAIIGPATHLMRGCEVGANSIVSGSILFEGARVGSHATVENSILDAKSSLGDRSRMESYSMLGCGAAVGKKVRMFTRSAVWPFVEISDEAVIEGRISLPEECYKRKLDEAGSWKR
ncbi:MAG: NDP-sugar synthase [Candidatus Micrarchaeota archaeon]|nr:NDP-sugar synthase [Candidatus Micrarchaeota archaeon]